MVHNHMTLDIFYRSTVAKAQPFGILNTHTQFQFLALYAYDIMHNGDNYIAYACTDVWETGPQVHFLHYQSP